MCAYVRRVIPLPGICGISMKTPQAIRYITRMEMMSQGRCSKQLQCVESQMRVCMTLRVAMAFPVCCYSFCLRGLTTCDLSPLPVKLLCSGDKCITEMTHSRPWGTEPDASCLIIPAPAVLFTFGKWHRF